MYIKGDTWTGGNHMYKYIYKYVCNTHMCIHTLPGNQSGIFLHLHDVLVSKDSGKKKKLHIDCLTLRLLVWGYMFHHWRFGEHDVRSSGANC